MDLDAHLRILLESYRRLFGEALCADPAGLFEAPTVVLAQGTESPPLLWYGNRRALELWEATWEEFTSLPARETAEPELREERARRLAEVARRGYVDDYRGVRVSRTGRRFYIEGARIWRVTSASGAHYGEAAMFERFSFLDGEGRP